MATPRQRLGRLKLFLGMCPGVGKTHAMLMDGMARRAEGVDVLIGCIEAHGREEIVQMTRNLPSLPALDVASVLAWTPELVLIDDLQQQNPPGARHRRRFQDVRDILDAGIDVHTTLDVWNLESRADDAAQITGIAVRDTVPDAMLQYVDEIELIDLSPDELLKRLAEGKVHAGDLSAAFFRKGNLTALREMALRVTAEHVDRQMRNYMRVEQITGPWRPSERLMVAVGDSVDSERVIRHTRRMAHEQQRFWAAVHVDTGRYDARSRAVVERNLALARELGAEVITTTDEDVVNGLLRVAQQHNITQIIVGRARMSGLRRLIGGRLIARLIDQSGWIDVHVIGGDDMERVPTNWLPMTLRASQPEEYVRALSIMAALVLVGDIVFQNIPLPESTMLLVYLFAVVLLSLRFAAGPVLAATALSAAAMSFFFFEPHYTLKIERISDWVLFFLYFAISAVVGVLTSRIRNTALLLRQSELQAVASFEFASVMSRAATMEEVCRAAIERISRLFDVRVCILLPDASGRLHTAVRDFDEPVPDSEFGVADWAFRHEQPAGRFTDTLATAMALHVPLLTAHGAVGVLCLSLEENLSAPQAELLRGLANQIALAVEREQLEEAATQSSMLQESERLSKTLLNLISHELRTPVTAIVGAASSLAEPKVDADAASRRQLHRSIRDSATRLDKLIENLLDMTRLESGTLRIDTDWTDVSDLVRTVRERIADELAGHEFEVEIEPDLPPVRMDPVLMEQVLYNLLHNAALYTPKGTRVRLVVQRVLCAAESRDDLVLTVMDRGPGLSAEDLARAFDKFHRVNRSSTTGLGLGLSICKGLVEAHGGAISAQNRRSGGLRVTIQLPIEPMPAVLEVRDE
jgi:two-component system sensor histidine kinase KdpD